MIKAGHMNRQHIHFYWRFKVLLIFLVLCWGGKQPLRAQYYPIHATVQWPSPQSPYLSDYYSGSRDRLIVNLLNRDLQQPLLFARLRIKIKSTGFLATSREEINYPMLELSANVPTRLTNIDLSPYLQPQNLQINGRLHNGQLPTGYTEFSVQVVDYYTGRTLSAWHTGRSYLDVKKPPLLNFPEKDAQIGITEPLYIRFQWMPRHQGLAGTEYEFVLKELPNNGSAPQSAFAYGNEIYRVRTRNTTLNYTHIEPVLFPNRCYAWQVQAIARDGVDEVGMFENGGYSEINWFYLNDNCQAPTGLRALPRFAKVDLSWNKVIGTTGYIVECRPKTKLNTYEWSRTRIAGEHLTLSQLKLGWTYEWRVGTLCTDDRPVFSGVSEFTLSKQNDELLADCGKEPVRKDLSQEPNLRIKAGDIVTIGGDYPMTIIDAVPLGDGWYSGRGKTRLKTIIDAPVALRFDRLRINVDNFQIDGTVEASYDEKKAKIANLDYVDDGGKDVKPATIRMREHKMNFTLPDIPQFIYNPKTGELETTDAEGNPQTIKIDVPENALYESIFPMLVTDNKGNTYQISPSEQNTEGTGNDVENENKDEKIELNCERVDRVGDFNAESLSSKYGYIHFKRGEGKYAFDDGQEKWYKKSVKVDRFYKPFAKGYIAPWKLVPVGENDIVMAKYDGMKNIDLKKVRFVSEPNSTALPARLNETEQTWTITLKSVSAGTSYDVFAVYEGVVIGKLRVVSYTKQQHKVTLVPVNEVKLDKTAIEQELNTIYNPVGVQFTVDIDESMRGNYDWEVESEKDGLLSTVGKSFWGYDKELKESTEMLNLQKTYQQAARTLDGVYLFVLNGAMGLEEQKGDLLGEMPRKSRFGYIFAGNSPNTEEIVHTIAHELGHGIFTLQHTFDAEYGKGTLKETENLLDYKEGTDLVAFQWNIMANPAVFTAMDKADDGKLGEKGSIWFTPTWVPFIYNDANTTMYRSDISNGTIGVIVKYTGNLSYAYTYDINRKAYYSKELQASLPIVTAKPSRKDKVFLLRHQTGEQLKVYQSTWDYVTSSKGKIIFDHNPDVKFLYQVKNVSGVNPKNDRNNKTQKHQDNKDSSKQGNRANVKNLLKNITDNFGRDAELCIDGKNYRLDTQGDNLEVDSILSDDEINRGKWTYDREYITRFSIDSTGTVQLQAFGIKESLSKNANHLDTLSVHIRQRTNELLAKNHVTNLGTTYLNQTETFADGDRIRIDGSYGKIISEGISLTTHLLKTGEIQSSAYLSSSGSAIHAPGLVTGSIEVVAQKVTDLTSLGTLAYDIATSEETRSNLVLQFKNIKDEIGEDPKTFFPIFRDVVLTVTTGNTSEEWDKSINSKDSGERNHLTTRGAGNAIVTLLSGTAIVKDLPEIADKLGDAVKKVKRISQTLEDFAAKSLPEKLEDIGNIWKTKYPVPDMLEGRTLFEDIMGKYRYKKSEGWVHTADIANNFKGVDFYKGTEIGKQIFAKTAVSMKTTILTDVNAWLNSKPIQDNIRFLKDGLENAKGMTSNGYVMKITKRAEVHIYMPRENATADLQKIWHNKLDGIHPKIKFEIHILEDYIK